MLHSHFASPCSWCVRTFTMRCLEPTCTTVWGKWFRNEIENGREGGECTEWGKWSSECPSRSIKWYKLETVASRVEPHVGMKLWTELKMFVWFLPSLLSSTGLMGPLRTLCLHVSPLFSLSGRLRSSGLKETPEVQCPLEGPKLYLVSVSWESLSDLSSNFPTSVGEFFLFCPPSSSSSSSSSESMRLSLLRTGRSSSNEPSDSVDSSSVDNLFFLRIWASLFCLCCDVHLLLPRPIFSKSSSSFLGRFNLNLSLLLLCRTFVLIRPTSSSSSSLSHGSFLFFFLNNFWSSSTPLLLCSRSSSSIWSISSESPEDGDAEMTRKEKP